MSLACPPYNPLAVSLVVFLGQCSPGWPLLFPSCSTHAHPSAGWEGPGQASGSPTGTRGEAIRGDHTPTMLCVTNTQERSLQESVLFAGITTQGPFQTWDRIIESLRLQKTSKIIKSNCQPNTTMPDKTCPKVPHLHVFWTPPGMVSPPLPRTACSNAWQPFQWRHFS